MTAVRIPLHHGLFLLVDDADAEAVSQFRWRPAGKRETYYARRRFLEPDGDSVRERGQFVHTFLTGWPRVDHINGNGLDNRRCNLRPATESQNQANRQKTKGTSRYKGVVWDTSRLRWLARIYPQGKQIKLGRFVSEEDAALAYDDAARRYFGDYAALNFPRPGEQSAHGRVAPVARGLPLVGRGVRGHRLVRVTAKEYQCSCGCPLVLAPHGKSQTRAREAMKAHCQDLLRVRPVPGSPKPAPAGEEPT